MGLASHNSAPNRLAAQAQRLACVSMASALMVGALAPPVSADERPSALIGDTSASPYEGAGALGSYGVSGFVFTRALEGDHFDRSIKSTGGSFSQGLLTDSQTGIEQCAFVSNDFIKNLKFDPPDRNICRKYLGTKDHPRRYIRQVNRCPEGINGKCVDGVEVPLVPGSDNEAFYKFAPARKGPDNVDYPAHGSGPFRPAGEITTPNVYYRYVRKAPDEDGKLYAMVRSDQYGWVWIRRSSLQMDFRAPPVGGTPKTKDTVAGGHPNARR